MQNEDSGAGQGEQVFAGGIRIAENQTAQNAGIEAAEALPTKPNEQQIRAGEAALHKWAASMVNARIRQGEAWTQEELERLREDEKNAADRVPYEHDQYTQAVRELEDLSRQRGLLGEAPREPKVWIFVLAGTVLGILFGIVGASTAGDILVSMLQAEEQEDIERLYTVGLCITIALGVGIGVFNLLIRRYAYQGSWVVRFGPFVTGLFMAIGLGGYRLIGENDTTGAVEFALTPIGLVLSCLEIGLLVAIEVVNETLLGAWERWHKASLEVGVIETQISRKQDVVNREKSEWEAAVEERDRARRAYRIAVRQREEARELKENRDAQVAAVAADAIHAFQNRIKSGAKLG